MADVTKIDTIDVAGIAKINGIDIANIGFLLGFGIGGEMGAVLNSIQFVSLSLGSNLITSVDMDKSVIIQTPGYRHSSAGKAEAIARITTNTNIEVDYLQATYFDVYVLEFSSGIKTVQRGVIVKASGSVTGTAAINEIVVANSICLQNGFGSAGITSDWRRSFGHVVITSNVLLTGSSQLTDVQLDLGWEILEFE